MDYFLNLFSPETWSAFQASGSTVSGFSRHQLTQAKAIEPGNIFLCYLVGLGRWCGALQIESDAFIDQTPLFKAENDPFIVRFRVSPIVLLQPEMALPVRDPSIWNRLTWTKEIRPGSVGWGANFQRSLRHMPNEDGEFLLHLLRTQAADQRIHELSPKDRRALNRATVRTAAGELPVQIPDEDEEAEEAQIERTPEVRQSHKVQSLIAEVGSKMGFKIWIPKADRERVKAASEHDLAASLIDILPMNYNDATIRTIEQIDVIWLRGRSIARAFEIE